jgi:hypothetical protein
MPILLLVYQAELLLEQLVLLLYIQITFSLLMALHMPVLVLLDHKVLLVPLV